MRMINCKNPTGKSVKFVVGNPPNPPAVYECAAGKSVGIPEGYLKQVKRLGLVPDVQESAEGESSLKVEGGKIPSGTKGK